MSRPANEICKSLIHKIQQTAPETNKEDEFIQGLLDPETILHQKPIRKTLLSEAH